MLKYSLVFVAGVGAGVLAKYLYDMYMPVASGSSKT